MHTIRMQVLGVVCAGLLASSPLFSEPPQVRTTLRAKQVYAVAFSPDGKTLASLDSNGIKLWDAMMGKHQANLWGRKSPSSLAFSPDGKTLAVAGCDIFVLVDAKTGKEIGVLDWAGHGPISSVAISPDGKTLATAGAADETGTIKLWDVATGKETVTLQGHRRRSTFVAFSPDGKTLASAGEDRTIRVWDMMTGKQTASFKGDHSVSFSPDGKTLAAASTDESIKLWDLKTSKEQATLKGHTKDVRSVVFTPDGTLLVSAGWDDTIRLWDMVTGKEQTALKHRLVSSVAISPDGKTMASVADETIKLWAMPVAK